MKESDYPTEQGKRRRENDSSTVEINPPLLRNSRLRNPVNRIWGTEQDTYFDESSNVCLDSIPAVP